MFICRLFSLWFLNNAIHERYVIWPEFPTKMKLLYAFSFTTAVALVWGKPKCNVTEEIVESMYLKYIL
jgi:hypothetical protein